MTRQDKQAITGNMSRHPKAAQRRVKLVRLLGSILHECKPVLETMRKAEAMINHCTRKTNGHEFAGYAVKSEVSDKYYQPLSVVSQSAVAAMDNEVQLA